MNRIYLFFLLFSGALLFSTETYSQDSCVTWVAPSAITGWVDFNTDFGGAPCDDGSGCPFNEITGFEVFASEAYTVNGFIAGAEYAFSMCNGPGAGTWVPDFTIIAPSGTVDAFGAGDGDGCTITWTASEDGTYMIVINEADNCGGGDNTAISNGFPALTCNGATCAPVTTSCNAGTLETSGFLSLCPSDSFNLNVIGDTIPTGGGFGYVFSPGVDGTGATEGAFVLSSASEMATYNNDLNGILSSNGLSSFVGSWIVRGAIYSDINNAFETICSTTEDSLVVNFVNLNLSVINDGEGAATVTANGGAMPYTYLWANGDTTQTAIGIAEGFIHVTVTEAGGCTATDSVFVTEGVSIDSVCVAGTLTTTGTIYICPLDSFSLNVISDTIPLNGGFGYVFTPREDGTGAIESEFIFRNVAQSISFNNDLNGALSGNGLLPFAGTWVIRGAVYTDDTNAFNSICSLTEDSLVVSFSGLSISIADNGDNSATANASGGVEPYTYAWSNGNTTQTATELDGLSTVTITDQNACSAIDSIFIGIVMEEACATWQEPSDTTGWTDFNDAFGGAPCDDGTGCPFNEITGFEVFASEAYSVDGFVAGGTYSFSMCNGPGAGTWIPDFTIIAPSGAVDAFGAGDGDGCTITWTASEDGPYLIVVNEADNCGGGDNTAVSNGFPALTCNTSTETMCEEVTDSTCIAGILTTAGSIFVCDTSSFDVIVTNDSIAAGGGFGYVFSPGANGAGALGGAFILSGANQMTSFNNDLGGILSSNGLAVFEGTWVIHGAVYTNANDPNNAFSNICDLTADSLVVTFGQSPIIEDLVDNGDGSATVTASGGIEPYIYQWADGQTTQTATGLPSGEVDVQVIDANGCAVTATLDIAVGLYDIDQLTSLSIFPNPASDKFFVEIALNTQEVISMQLYDFTGKKVQNLVPESTTLNTFEFNVANYPAGIYVLHIQIGEHSVSRKIVVE